MLKRISCITATRSCVAMSHVVQSLYFFMHTYNALQSVHYWLLFFERYIKRHLVIL